MLVKLFPNLENNKLIGLINKFFYSYFYLGFIALLTLLTCIFGFEMYTFYIYVLCGGLIPCLFCKDMTPVFAPLGMAYSSISLHANNVVNHKSLFGGRWYHLYILLALIFLVIGTRFVFELVTNKEKRHYKPYLLPGYLAFGIALMTAGLGSQYYSLREFTFGLVEFLALSGCYFLLMYLIDWKVIKKDYYAWLMMFYGLCIAMEVFILRGLSGGTRVRTGWGINNNIAAQMCMCLAGPMYLAIKKKWCFIYLILEGIILLAIAATNSRNGALMGMIICVLCYVIFLIKVDKPKRIQSIILAVSAAALFTAFAFIFPEIFKTGFARLIGEKGNPASLNGRDRIWTLAYNNFLNNPSFGSGWYQCTIGRSDYFSYSFVPGRYHNTFFQLIGAMGLFGLVTYIFHRYQTIRMTFKKPTLEKTFIFISIGGLLLTSIFDNHFFNLGPGLNYCIALAFIEGLNIQSKQE